MEIEVRMQSTHLTGAIRRYAARRIRFALGRFAPRIGRVVVRISDINGVRGGVDQCCHITGQLSPKVQKVVHQVDADLFTAIDRASERIGEAVRREVQKTRDTGIRREFVTIRTSP